MNEVEISVIIPCYNQGAYLYEAIRSVESLCHQQSFVVEIIVINDGSDDSFTLDVLEKLRNANYNIISQKNGGLSSARNTGLINSSGRYIQFLDADDILLGDKFARQLEDFAVDPELDVCVANFLFSQEKLENRFTLKTHSAFFSGNYPLYDFLFRWERGFTVPIHCFLFRRELFFQNKQVEFDSQLCSREDWLMWCYFALNGAKFKFDNTVMAIYRMHNTSMTKKVIISLKGYMMASMKIANLIQDRDMCAQFIELSASHMCDEYLFEYKNSIIPSQVIPVCYGKFRRLCVKILKK